MPMQAPKAGIVTEGDLGDNVAAFLRSLRAEVADGSMSPATVDTYGSAVALFAGFLTRHGYPTDVADITREHIEEWRIELSEGSDAHRPYAPASVHNRLRGLQRFMSYLVERGRIDTAPVVKLPKLANVPMRILSMDELAAVMNACKGRTFETGARPCPAPPAHGDRLTTG